MTDQQQWLRLLGIVVVASPFLATLVLGISSLLDRKLSEKATTRLVSATIATGLPASVAILAAMLYTGTRSIPVDLGDWVAIPGFHFSVNFVFDRLSVPFVILSYVLSGTIGAFATKYMHREWGFNRFFVLYAVFLLGMVLTALAGSIETLFAGWELVGLSSALLVAFFQERSAPARNGLWVWVVYRFSDAALLLAAVAIHHLSGDGDFDVLFGAGLWPEAHSTVTAWNAFAVGSLLLLAAMGKSALVPFSGWLPRAMEGPTPSSAVFYGALSVHLGAFLLLRAGPLVERSGPLCAVIFVVGLATAIFAYLAGSVQTDVKAALTFASLSQVGIIVAEIGLAWFSVIWFYVALIHLIGHACLRTLQFVRAPSLLHDYHMLENAIGDHLPHVRTPWETNRHRAWVYRLGLERGYLDAMLLESVVSPFVRGLRWCDALERRWTDFLAGEASRESDQVKPHFGNIEELS